MPSTTDALAQRLTDDMNACRHFGLQAHERVRRDTRLAWLRDQRVDVPVTSFGGLFKYWNEPETFRQQRIIALIAAREQQLRMFPGPFAYWMNQARRMRRTEFELRTMEVAA